jgi:predicted nucleic acid-binding protein
LAHFTAIYDACVLYPAPLRDLLIRLAVKGLFRAKWTETIHTEWVRNLLANRSDLSPEQLARTCQLMNEHVPDSVVSGYEYLIPTLSLPDQDDRHVLAASIRAHANVIVTFNLKDFPAEVLADHEIEAQHPDDFLTHLVDLSPWVVCQTVKEQREDLKNPPQSANELLATFEALGLLVFVSRLREMLNLI